MNQPLSMADIRSNAGWHLYQFDFARESCEWLQLSEAQFRAASFLDQRIRSAALAAVTLPAAALQSALEDFPDANAACIFHIGHCGSTLVSRALAATPGVLPVREPLSLRQLSGSRPELPPARWRQWLQLALAAHSRPFHPGQLCMIKATSSGNALIQPIAGLMPSARMLLVYVPLESYLAGLLGKQTPAADMRGHAALRLQEWRAISGEDFPIEASALNEAQLAVLAWMTSMARLVAASDAIEARCLLLDFDQFLAEPEGGLDRLIGFFGLRDSGAEILRAWPEISLAYSKQPDQPYSAFNRNRTQARGRLQRAAEIQGGLEWAQQLIRRHQAFTLCSPYL